jgi:hypothetical protein
MSCRCRSLYVCLVFAFVATIAWIAAETTPPQSAGRIEFKLKQPAVLTSAGVYDGAGLLVRTLWTMQPQAAGRHTVEWDGLDDFTNAAPAGEYYYKVIVNGSTYTNVGAIGQNYEIPNDKGHVPSHMASVAADRAGAVYTANGWDEAGADFKKWDQNGKSVYDAQYQMRNGNPNGAPYAIAVDEEFIYCAMEGWASKPWNNKQQIQRFRISTGKKVNFTNTNAPGVAPPGHIQIYEWPQNLIPTNTPEAELRRMKYPLRALTIGGETIYCADYLGNRVLKFHKVTGEAQGEFPVKQPQAVVVTTNGRVLVGHEHSKVTAFSATGVPEAVLVSGLSEVEALALAPDGRLYVADGGAGQVKIFDVTKHPARLTGTLGKKAQWGDREADRCYTLVGVAVDPQGFIFTIQNEPIAGARLARWTPGGKLLWEKFSNEFVSLGNYGPHDPDIFWTMSFHRYALQDRARGEWEYLNNTWSGGARYHSDTHGVIRPLRLGKSDFVFMPTGDGMQVYRVEGKLLRLSALIGGKDPTPAGKVKTKEPLGRWSWHNANGTGVPATNTLVWTVRPGEKGANYAVFGMDVDRQGHLWFGELHTKAIWTIPLRGFDARGNPVYNWADAREAVPRDKSPLGFEPNMANRADDGSIYAFGWSKVWPAPKNNPFWMGGTTLVRFDAAGKRLWAVKLPQTCVGFDTVPGKDTGIMVGAGTTAEVFHFGAGGLLLGVMKPGEAMGKQSGWMDNHACVAVARHPRDHRLDVFTEDDYVLRIGWYRVDDRNIQVLEGKVPR